MDSRVERLAGVLVNYCVGVEAGDWVAISGALPSEPLVAACVSQVLKAGGHPTALWASSHVSEILLREGSDEQIAFLDPLVSLMLERADKSIAILAPINTRALADIDPARLAIQNKSMGPIMDTVMKRWADGTLRSTGTAFPTEAAAQDAGMSLRAYEDFVYGAGLLSEPDPVEAWRALGRRQQRIADWLGQRKTLRVTGKGIDLTVGVAGRTWINDQGHVNFPGGEVFTGPIEDQTEGTVEFNLPGFYSGREVTGVRLVFERGVVVEASARTDDAFLQEMLNLDDGARRLGEFAFGLNPGIQRFTKSTLFDEKIGGTLHMALGRSIPGTGGENISSLHWDIVFDLRNGAEVTADGELFSHDGEIVI